MSDTTVVPLWTLTLTEETDRDRMLGVAEAILRAGVWTDPILVQRETRVVLHGRHRLAAAKRLGLSAVPVRLVDDRSSASALAALAAPSPVPLALLRGPARFAVHVRWIWKAGDPVPERATKRYAAG